jgi:hypothetical protein
MIQLAALLDPDILTDPFGWILTGLLHAVFGAGDRDAATRMLDDLVARFFAPADPHSPFRLEAVCGPCGAISASLRPLGLFALGVAVVARIVVLAMRCRSEGISPVHLLADIGIRLVCGVAAIEGIFTLLAWLSTESMALAGGLVEAVLKVALQNGPRPTLAELALGALLPQNTVGSTLAILLLALFIGYLVVMVIASRAALIFTVLAAPFSIPALVYTEESQLVLLWLRMLVFALAVPAAAVLCLSFTVLLLMVSTGVQVLSAVLPLVGLVVATWLSVKIINGLMAGTIRHARGGVGGTLRVAGMAPGARGTAQAARQTRPFGRPGRFAAGGAMFGPGIRQLVKLPPKGSNVAFDMFVAQRLLQAGISSVGGDDLPEKRQRALRSYYWARYLAQEILPIDRGEKAA